MTALRFGEIYRPVLASTAKTQTDAQHYREEVIPDILANRVVNLRRWQEHDQTIQKVVANKQVLLVDGEDSQKLNAELAKVAEQEKQRGAKDWLAVARQIAHSRLTDNSPQIENTSQKGMKAKLRVMKAYLKTAGQVVTKQFFQDIQYLAQLQREARKQAAVDAFVQAREIRDLPVELS